MKFPDDVKKCLQPDPEWLSKQFLFVATPSHDGRCEMGYCASIAGLTQLAMQHRFDFQFEVRC